MNGADDDRDDEEAFSPLILEHAFPPPAATVEVTFGAHSRRGDARAINEDHYLIVRLGRHQETVLTSLPDGLSPRRYDEYGYAMVVADGIGDAGAGERASRIAVTTLAQLALHFGKWNLRIDDEIAHEIMGRARRFYSHVDATVLQRVQSHAAGGAQTTLTAIFGAGRDLFFAHVGHSRAYLSRQGTLLRLTRDHTVERVGSGGVPLAPLVDVNTAARDLRHILTNTIGMSGPMGPAIDLERFEIDDDDRVLVCTNGLTDFVEEARIAEVLAWDQSPDTQCRALVHMALTSGSIDDVTALIARYRVPSG